MHRIYDTMDTFAETRKRKMTTLGANKTMSRKPQYILKINNKQVISNNKNLNYENKNQPFSKKDRDNSNNNRIYSNNK